MYPELQNEILQCSFKLDILNNNKKKKGGGNV